MPVVYDRRAATYDWRWARYIAATAEETLHRLALDGSERRLLDVGCGTGTFLQRVAITHPTLQGVGVDMSLAMLKRARAKLGARAWLVCARAEGLPFRKDMFDRIVAISVPHEWRDPGMIFQGMRSLLAPSGRLILTDWCAEDPRVILKVLFLKAIRDPAFFRAYRTGRYQHLIAEAGYEMIRIDRYGAAGWGMMTAIARVASRARGSIKLTKFLSVG